MKISKKNILMSAFVLAVTMFSVMAMYGEKVVSDAKIFWVSHTEYWANEEGQTIVRLQNFKGNPITANWCNVTIYYPDKTAFVTNQAMSPNSIAGNYYYNFTTPNTMGIYEEFVNCSYGSPNEKFISTSESFHMNPALNMTWFLNQTLYDMNATFNQTLGDVVVNVTAIRNDTMWLVDNVVNGTAFDDWKDNATNQINEVKTNVTLAINNLCTYPESNASDLCQTLWNIYAFQQAQNITFTNYFENITETTTNLWNFTTGTLFTKLNDTYNLVFDINATVGRIEENVSAIRQDQVDEVYINIIS